MTSRNPGSGSSEEFLATVAAVAQLIDVLQTMEEAASGWRTHLTKNGWPKETADRLATDLLIAWQGTLIRALMSPPPV